jgi:thioesterase domain-containing protein
LRTGPAGRVLCLFHALGGEVFSYREVARRITSPVRVLGVRWAGAPDADLPLTEVARIHREQLQAVQPMGPYLLAGWSFGGVLAFEVAQQLRAAGERVEFLGLLDANPVRDPITGLPPDQTRYLALLTDVLAELDRRGLDGADPVGVAEFATDEVWTVLMGGAPAAGMRVAHLRRNLEIACQSMRGVRSYVPRGYPGDVDLFQANASPARLRADLTAALRGVTDGELRVHSVPGDHNSMLARPQVTVLAEAVDVALDNIIEKAGVHDGS